MPRSRSRCSRSAFIPPRWWRRSQSYPSLSTIGWASASCAGDGSISTSSGLAPCSPAALLCSYDGNRRQLLLYDDYQRLVFRRSAVHDQGLADRDGAVIASKMNQLGRNDPCIPGLEQRAPLAFDFHDQTAFHDVQQFLSARMHVPGGSAAGPKFDNANDGLLHGLALAFEIMSQDLRQLRPRLSLRQPNVHQARGAHCQAGKAEEFATDELHDSLPQNRC